jgi:hypothetical protein
LEDLPPHNVIPPFACFIQPTLTIRPGFPVRVIVNRDLVLAPYQG